MYAKAHAVSAWAFCGNALPVGEGLQPSLNKYRNRKTIKGGLGTLPYSGMRICHPVSARSGSSCEFALDPDEQEAPYRWAADSRPYEKIDKHRSEQPACPLLHSPNILRRGDHWSPAD